MIGANMKKNIYEKIFEKPCAVCGSKVMVDIFRQGKCPHCEWNNGLMVEDNEDKVIYPNLVSLNKAKELYKQGKAFVPNIYEFFEALNFYSEMQFKYKEKYYGVVFANNDSNENAIEIFEFNNKSKIFSSVADFIENAKIGEEYIRNIWEETTERNWLK